MTQTTRTIAFVHALRDFEPEARRQLEGHNLLFLKSREAMAERIAELDVVVTGYMWDNGLIPQADRLAYLQTVSSGTEAFDLPALKDKGIAVCNARGVNATTTAEHGIGLMMAMSRQLHRARDNQHAKRWQMNRLDPAQSEARTMMELHGKRLLQVGFGEIGQRVHAIASAFGMDVTVLSRTARPGATPAIKSYSAFAEEVAEADVILFCCPLSDETRHMLDAAALEKVKPSAFVVNIARGGVIDQDALIAALQDGRLRGAGLDVTTPEPLPEDSPLWDMSQVLITPHNAGDTPAYEERICRLVKDNLTRLDRGETELINSVA